jgi:hypothetical protein
VPDARKAIRHTLEILAIAAPLAAMTYFLFDPDAFNAFLDWLFKISLNRHHSPNRPPPTCPWLVGQFE